jgi:hypothetical protein
VTASGSGPWWDPHRLLGDGQSPGLVVPAGVQLPQGLAAGLAKSA